MRRYCSLTLSDLYINITIITLFIPPSPGQLAGLGPYISITPPVNYLILRDVPDWPTTKWTPFSYSGAPIQKPHEAGSVTCSGVNMVNGPLGPSVAGADIYNTCGGGVALVASRI